MADSTLPAGILSYVNLDPQGVNCHSHQREVEKAQQEYVVGW